MSGDVNRRILLRARPDGRIDESIFETVREAVPEPGPGDAVVRTTWISLDPTNRLWMNGTDTYLPAVPLGAPMRALGLGQVVASQDDAMPVGATVVGATGWQDYLLASEAEMPFTVLPDDLPVDARHALGVLGHTGQTAYYGLTDIGRPKPGETVVVSAAAGAVGSVAGQMARAMGAGRVVGLAGTDEKCRLVTEQLGFDACVNHKAAGWRAQLDAACPDGVDVDFEMAGGEILDHVFSRMNVFGRVVICGLISQYNREGGGGGWPGPRNFDLMIMRRLRVEGFLVLDHMAQRGDEAQAAIAGWMAEGAITPLETIDDSGLDNVVNVLNRLYDGDNVGKLLVKVADPPVAA